MSQPDLFVVCKNCGSEVSPYVTECPYCGQRVRKRAPKLDRSRGEPEPKQRRRRARLPRLRSEEIAGIAPETPPYATFALIAISLATTVLYAADSGLDPGYLFPPANDAEVWRWFTSPFLHSDLLGYQFVVLLAAGIFGTLLERRFSHAAPVIVFVFSGAAGSALAVVSGIGPLLSHAHLVYPVIGANGAALGLLCAWLVDDRMAARRGFDRESDLIGVYVCAVVLLLLSLAVIEANVAAAIGGALAGALMGLALPLVSRRNPSY